MKCCLSLKTYSVIHVQQKKRYLCQLFYVLITVYSIKFEQQHQNHNNSQPKLLPLSDPCPYAPCVCSVLLCYVSIAFMWVNVVLYDLLQLVCLVVALIVLPTIIIGSFVLQHLGHALCLDWILLWIKASAHFECKLVYKLYDRGSFTVQCCVIKCAKSFEWRALQCRFLLYRQPSIMEIIMGNCSAQEVNKTS